MRPVVGALMGATVLVEHPEQAARSFIDMFGWARRAKGRLGSATFITVAAAGTDRGMVRFLEGPEAAPVKELRKGWASIEVVVRHVDALSQRLTASDAFRVRSGPVTFDLTEHGSNVHRALTAWGPGGLLLGCTMAVTQPRGRRFAEAGDHVGPVFSVGLRTSNLDRTSGLYHRALGMETLLEVAWQAGEWHRMWNVPEGDEAALRLLKGEGEGTGLGTIEVQSFPAHLIGGAALPGIACVTYTTRSLPLARTSAEREAQVVAADTSSFTMIGDVGERLEVLEGGW